jgi:hypothetical protein
VFDGFYFALNLFMMHPVKSNTPQAASSGVEVLDEEARNILSEATKGIPAEIWQAIALAEQTEAPEAPPVFVYTSSGTSGVIHAVES